MSIFGLKIADGGKTLLVAIVLIGSTGVTAKVFKGGLVFLGYEGFTTGTAGVILFVVAFTVAFGAVFGGLSLWYSKQSTNGSA